MMGFVGHRVEIYSTPAFSVFSANRRLCFILLSFKTNYFVFFYICLYTNAYSMGNKQELEAMVQLENYNLIAIKETWWDKSHS